MVVVVVVVAVVAVIIMTMTTVTTAPSTIKKATRVIMMAKQKTNISYTKVLRCENEGKQITHQMLVSRR